MNCFILFISFLLYTLLIPRVVVILLCTDPEITIDIKMLNTINIINSIKKKKKKN